MQRTLKVPSHLVGAGQNLGIAHGQSEGVAALDVADATLLGSQLGGSLSWAPLGRVTWGALLHHLVDLLEREALGLWNQEVCVDKGACAESSPDEED